ncbi:hypothetical protein ACF0H5_003527 [Mactra antiquata]
MIQRRLNNGEADVLPSQASQISEKEGDKKMSFFTKMRKGAEKRQQNKTSRLRTLVVFRGLMLFQGSTELYVLCRYIIPFVYQDYSPMTIYYIKVIAWFAILNMLANWTCVMLYDSGFLKTKDNPNILTNQSFDTPPEHFVSRLHEQTDGHSVYSMGTSEDVPWRYCEKCQLWCPFRCHHCTVCQKCILKKDHHCYLVGNCIGLKNQRYFIIMMFYVGIVGLGGGYITLQYVKQLVWPGLETWTDTVLPLTVWRSLFGNVKIWHCFLIFHLHIEFIFGFLAVVYFLLQMMMISEGKTLYEVQKNVPVRILTSMNKNIKSVFGDFWAFNFLFPMTLIFRQTEDGVQWSGVKLLNKSIDSKTMNHLRVK